MNYSSVVDSGEYGDDAFGGGMYLYLCSADMSGDTIYDNGAFGFSSDDAWGGGIYMAAGLGLTMNNSTVTENAAEGGDGEFHGGNGRGGGIVYSGATATLNGVQVCENAASGGNADTESAGNVGGGIADGGGLYFAITDGDQFTMRYCTVCSNSAVGGDATGFGGFAGDDSIYVVNGGYATDGGVHVTTVDGEGAEANNGLAVGCTIANNGAHGGIATINNSDLYSGSPYTVYGAFGGFAQTGGITIEEMSNCTVYGNTAVGGEGAASDDGYFKAEAGAAIAGGYGRNASLSLGDFESTTFYAYNSTIAVNSAIGGIAFEGGIESAIRGGAYGGGVGDATVAQDGLGSGDPTLTITPAATIDLYSTIVAMNTVDPQAYGAGGNGPDIYGCYSLGFNLIGYGDASSATNFTQGPFTTHTYPDPNSNYDIVGPDLFSNPLDPFVTSSGVPVLANNGGPTKTVALTDDSIALDMGQNGQSYANDQRGFPYVRTYALLGTPTSPYDGTDIGAFELVPVFYADRDWATDTNGEGVTDADPVQPGDQPAVYGTNAFSTIDAALAAVPALGGVVIVNGYDGSTSGSGDFAETTNPEVKNGVSVLFQYGDISLSSSASTSPVGLTIDTGGAVEITATLGGLTGDGIVVDVANLTSHGTLSIDPGSAAHPTTLSDSGTTGFDFDDGSLTNVGSIGTEPSAFNGYAILAQIDMNGLNAVVQRSSTSGHFTELINNGYVGDLTVAGTAYITCNGGGVTGGALIKGAGEYGNAVSTTNGGHFQAGNCPGQATFDEFAFGPDGVNNYNFEIDDATGTAGPNPDASGHLDGNSLIRAKNLAWNATADNPLVINLMTLLNPSTPGSDDAGAMDSFDDTQAYSWTLAAWTGTYTGPTDDAALNASVVFNTSGFVNAVNGTFALHIDASAGTISLTYTPNP